MNVPRVSQPSVHIAFPGQETEHRRRPRFLRCGRRAGAPRSLPEPCPRGSPRRARLSCARAGDATPAPRVQEKSPDRTRSVCRPKFGGDRECPRAASAGAGGRGQGWGCRRSGPRAAAAATPSAERVPKRLGSPGAGAGAAPEGEVGGPGTAARRPGLQGRCGRPGLQTPTTPA